MDLDFCLHNLCFHLAKYSVKIVLYCFNSTDPYAIAIYQSCGGDGWAGIQMLFTQYD